MEKSRHNTMILHSVCHRPRQIVCTIPENCCSCCCLEARFYHENPDLPAGCDFEPLLDRQATAGRPVVLFSHGHLRKECSCGTSSTALVTKLALSMNHHQINTVSATLSFRDFRVESVENLDQISVIIPLKQSKQSPISSLVASSII